MESSNRIDLESMYPYSSNSTKQILIEEVQELEDAYAEALSDETDARTLSTLWDRIKLLNREINELEKGCPQSATLCR